MKQTVEQMKKTFTTLMNENGFQYTGQTAYNGSFIYAREWKRTSQVCWCGETESTYRIEAYESYGIPLIRLYQNGRIIGHRDYSSPKRAMNAMREIIRCAGYEF